MALLVQRKCALLLGLVACNAMVRWCKAEEWLQLDPSPQYDIYNLNKMAPINFPDAVNEVFGLSLEEFNRDFPEDTQHGLTLMKDVNDLRNIKDSDVLKDFENFENTEGSGKLEDLNESEDSKDTEDSESLEGSGKLEDLNESEDSKDTEDSESSEDSGKLEDLNESEDSKDTEDLESSEGSGDSEDLNESEDTEDSEGSGDTEGSGDLEDLKYSEDSKDSKNSEDSKDSESLKRSGDSKGSWNSESLEDSVHLKYSEDSKDSENSEHLKDSKDSKGSNNAVNLKDWVSLEGSNNAEEDSDDWECKDLSCYARQASPEVREAPQVVRSPPCSPTFPLVPVFPDFTVYFTSPNYPDPFPPFTQCGWTFSSTVGTHLRLLCTPVTLGIRDYLLVKEFADGGRVFGVTNENEGVVRSQFTGNAARVGLLAYGGETAGCFRCWMSAIPNTQPIALPVLTPVTAPPTTTPPTTTPPAKRLATTQPPATQPPPTTTAKPAAAPQVQPKIPSTPFCRCGRAAFPRIVGGTEASEHTHPWLVALAYPVGTGQLSVFCGGSLISSHFVLTAAHCVRAIQQFRRPDIHLLLGVHSLDRIGGPGTLDESPLEYIVHPAFNNQTLDSDLGLIRIAPLDLSRLPDTIRPVCLPPSWGKMYDGAEGVVAGWGSLGNGSVSPRVLMEAALPILPQSQCRSLLGNVLTDNMQCAGLLAGGKDSCQGDSGGPLVVTDDLSGIMELAGVVSWGYGCAQARKPGVYVRVAQFLPWLVQATAGSITCVRN